MQRLPSVRLSLWLQHPLHTSLLLVLPTPAHSTAVQRDANPPAHIPRWNKENTGKAYSNPSMPSLGRCQNKHSWEIHIYVKLKSVRVHDTLFVTDKGEKSGKRTFQLRSTITFLQNIQFWFFYLVKIQNLHREKFQTSLCCLAVQEK